MQRNALPDSLLPLRQMDLLPLRPVFQRLLLVSLQ
jgi:hypothetical protein